MVQKHRISTNIGVDQKVTVELKQDFDMLEILSLKFTQQQVYTSLCSDYGVVCGRVTANNGFGVGNARVSIFVPLSEDDENDPVISSLYPYKEVTDKDENGYRYNLLPSRKQHGGHAETGTFPDQSDILGREEYLEVYEKYYRYTVKTNTAGDFMIWGVPVGLQSIHVDVDLSDIGCFSLRPADFQRLGVGVDQFKNKYTFKSSEDLDSLPQIIKFDRNVEVYPFWGNEDLCEIGITRTDFDLSERGVNIQPKAYLIGGVFTDTGKNSVNKNCIPRRKMGRKCDLITKSANIEAIRFMPIKDEQNRPYLEYLPIDEDVPDDGGFVLPLEMNMDYVITNEFGENEITNDPNKGIPTSACYRFRFNLNDNGLDRTRANADFLVPNIREFQTGLTIDDRSYYFGTDWDGYRDEMKTLILNNQNGEFYPQDYFYRFTYNKVYTVSSFHSHFLGVDALSKGLAITAGAVTGGIYGAALGSVATKYNFANINEILPTEEEDCSDKVTPPTNFGVRNYTFQLLIADFLLVLDYVFNLVTLVITNTIAKLLSDIAEILVPISPKARPIRGVKNSFIANNGVALKLITYPDCEECEANVEENNCQYYDTLYDDSLVTGYFVEDPTVTQVISCSGESCVNTNILPGNTGRKYVQTSAQLQTEIAAGRKLLATAIYGDNNFVNRPTSYYPYNLTGTNNGITSSNHTGQNTLYGADFGAANTFTPSRRSEFSNGVFYIVPGSQTNNRLIKIVGEYYRRKRVGKMFCGGIVNYGFIDNWLSGSLYFTQFKAKKLTKLATATSEAVLKYCRNLVWFVFDQSKFYYRSAKFSTTSGFDRDNLNRPTTIVDLGPRDEFIKEICIDAKLDPNCSVARSIGSTSYQPLGELLALAINYRMDVANKNGNLNLFFNNNGFYSNLNIGNVLDGDILQLLSTNNEVGIEQFDLENPKYLGYRFDILDPEDNETFFKVDGDWGPLPVTLELDEDGDRVRSCLNEPGRLGWDSETYGSSQTVPFYLWNKKGSGFGPGGTNRSNQSWDYESVVTQPLQGMTYGYQFTGGTNDPSDKYLLLPITKTNNGITGSTNLNLTDVIEFDVVIPSTSTHTSYDDEYPGFSVLKSSSSEVNNPTSGTLYIRWGTAGNWQEIPWTPSTDLIIPRRQDYYGSNTKQILSTPFQFYFGLLAGKTGVDKFIDLYGPKGAFDSLECETSSLTPTTSPTPTPTVTGPTSTPTPTASGPTPTPTETGPTPTPTTTPLPQASFSTSTIYASRPGSPTPAGTTTETSGTTITVINGSVTLKLSTWVNTGYRSNTSLTIGINTYSPGESGQGMTGGTGIGNASSTTFTLGVGTYNITEWTVSAISDGSLSVVQAKLEQVL
jgi:hypothetical protein